MKGKTKQAKGITLIALIITIVVLLILAAVAISSITNDGILSYATNAAKDYNQAVANEANMLGDYLNYLNNSTSTKATLISFTIGMNATQYQAEKGMTWAEWCESEYNVNDYFVASGASGPARVWSELDSSGYSGRLICLGSGSASDSVSPEDAIIDKGAYFFASWSD